VAKEIIDAIYTAEKRAKQIKSTASNDAEKLISNAKEEASSLVIKAREGALKEYGKIISNANDAFEKIVNTDCFDDELINLKSQIEPKIIKAAREIKKLI